MEELLAGRLCKYVVSNGVQGASIDGQALGGAAEGGGGFTEDVGEGKLVLPRGVSKRPGIEGEVGIVEFAGADGGNVLVRSGREKNDVRGSLAVVCAGLEVGQEGVETLAEVRQALRSGEGLVGAERSDDDVGLEIQEVLIEVPKVVGARLEVDFIGRPGEVADPELVLGKALVEQGFEVAEAPLGIEEEIANECNPGPGGEIERQAGPDRGGLGRARRGLEVDIVIRQARILGRCRLVELGVLAVRLYRLFF